MTALADLEARVSALELDAGGADQLNPNVLTVNPDGTIGANFTGHIHAKGLDLDAALASGRVRLSAIDWLQVDGQAIASIEAAVSGGATKTLSSLVIAIANEFLQNTMATTSGVGDFHSAQWIVQRGSIDAVTLLKATVVNAAGSSIIATLLDALGQSSYLQLGHLGQSITGSAVLTWPGGASQVVRANIALPFIPAGGVMACPDAYSLPGVPVLCSAGIGPGSNLTIRLDTTGALPAAGTTTTVYWLAWT